MSDNKPFMAIIFLLVVMLVACGPTAVESGVEGPTATSIPETTQPSVDLPATETPATDSAADAITVAAKAHLAGELGVPESEIEVISAEMTEFTDSCLGLGQPNESCLQALTPGWLVILDAMGQEYEVRSDETGEQMRIATEAESAADPAAATAAAVTHLASELGVAEATIELVSLEGAEFADSCLGLGQPNESCLQALTSGWVVILGVDSQEYELRTDATGQQVRMAGEPE